MIVLLPMMNNIRNILKIISYSRDQFKVQKQSDREYLNSLEEHQMIDILDLFVREMFNYL